MLKLDRNSPLPLYHQLLQILIDRINADELQPGDMLPPEKDLELTYGVSRVTVRRAMDELARQGLVVRQRGKGTFIAEKVTDARANFLRGLLEYLNQRGVPITARVLAQGFEPASAGVAHALNLNAGAPVYHIRRVGISESVPLVVSDFWFETGPGEAAAPPPELGESASIYTTLDAYMKEHQGRILSGGTKSLEAVSCTEQEAALLETSKGTALLRVKIIYTDQFGVPAVSVNARYRGDRYVYTMDLGSP